MEILLIALLTFFASGLDTLTGFGSSTLMVPILLLFLPLPETLLFVGIIHWISDIWKIIFFKKSIRWDLILKFSIPGIIATYIGASLIFAAPEEILLRILGGFLTAYAIFIFIKHTFKIKENTKNIIAGGAISGFLAGLFGVGGAIRSLFLTAFNLPKTVYLATIGAAALAIDSTRIATYFMNGVGLKPLLAWGLILFIPASFFGAEIAKQFVSKIPQKRFRTIISVFLLLIGLKLLLIP